MKNFKLVGMKSPGRVNLLGFGTVELENVSDQLAENIYLSGCRYLQPTAEYFPVIHPDVKPIEIRPLAIVEKENDSL